MISSVKKGNTALQDQEPQASSQPPAREQSRTVYSTSWGTPQIQVSTSLAPEMAERLRILAYQTGRTKGYLIRFAVEQYMDVIDKRENGAGA